MGIVRTHIAGQLGLVLVLHLPAKVVDDTSDAIRDEVRHRLKNCDGAGLVLDCSDVDLINSIGITCLLQVQDQCRRQKAAMYLASVPPNIAKFLKQLKLDLRFQQAPTIEDAVAAIEKQHDKA